MYGDATTPANQFGSQAGEAWAAGKTGSNTVWIGIIDEGYMYTHEDLSANAGTNPGEIAGNGKDDDGNGYVDDVYGWDFANNNNTVFDGTADDHGTHVAGTIGAVGGNSKGVVGVVWQVKLINAKFLGNSGGTTANAIKAVDYFTDLKLRHGINLVATNNSWGGGGYSQGLYDAIERANQAGILFIAAAGNSTNDNDANPSYPASYNNTNIIAVASIDSNGALSSFSNWGATSVDLGAPGRGIVSTVPQSSRGRIVSGYASYSGISMATPHVTGGAALYAASHPGASASQIKNAILNSVVPTASLSGKTLTGGRLNVSSF
jgi:subtilisin family serine protease